MRSRENLTLTGPRDRSRLRTTTAALRWCLRNRAVTSRSDSYARGVTFYEMLTGQLPFTAADPMEWVPCHVARQPVPPNEQGAGVPARLSAIVMKLLAKTGEERYQTAAGVEADLRRCLADLELYGRIDRVPLGDHDGSGWVLVP